MFPTSDLEPRRHRSRRRRRHDKDITVFLQTEIFDMKAERVETKSNEAQAMELEAQVFEAERDRTIPEVCWQCMLKGRWQAT